MRKFMKSFGTASVVLAVVAAGSAPVAWSHSLKDLQTQLGDREKYFQPIDKDAPAFRLQAAGGVHHHHHRSEPGQGRGLAQPRPCAWSRSCELDLSHDQAGPGRGHDAEARRAIRPQVRQDRGRLSDPRHRHPRDRQGGALAGEFSRPAIRTDQSRRLRQRAGQRYREAPWPRRTKPLGQAERPVRVMTMRSAARPPTDVRPRGRKRNRNVVLVCASAAVVAIMVALTYASVPPYRLFYRANARSFPSSSSSIPRWPVTRTREISRRSRYRTPSTTRAARRCGNICKSIRSPRMKGKEANDRKASERRLLEDNDLAAASAPRRACGDNLVRFRRHISVSAPRIAPRPRRSEG